MKMYIYKSRTWCVSADMVTLHFHIQIAEWYVETSRHNYNAESQQKGFESFPPKSVLPKLSQEWYLRYCKSVYRIKLTVVVLNGWFSEWKRLLAEIKNIKLNTNNNINQYIHQRCYQVTNNIYGNPKVEI